MHLWPIAQRIRAKQTLVQEVNLHPITSLWAERAIALDLRLREIVQREAALKDKYERLANQSTFEALEKWQLQGQENQMEKWTEELKDLNVRYWDVQQQIHDNDERLPNGPTRRAYLSLHKRPNWYLHPWLCKDCAGRGGCCSRACGCCRKSRNLDRPRGLGHCTEECQCCIKARGFVLDHRRRSDRPQVNLLSLNGYSRRMYQAWQWGQGVESSIDP